MDVDELRAKVLAPTSGYEHVHEAATRKDYKIREEGELSSSENEDNGDDNEKYGVCTAVSTGMVMHPKEPVSLSLENGSSPRIEDGEAVYDNNILSSLNIQSHVIQPAFRDTFDKHQNFPAATTSGWGPSFNANPNLVICFSDNDGGSDTDTEEHIKEKVSKPQNNFVKNRRLPPISQAKSHKSSQSLKNASKVIPKKLPLSRSIVSSLVKTGGNNSMAGPALLEQGSRLRSFNNLNISQLNREHGFDQGLSVNDCKLKDLREQIALRESELKLKSVMLNKESISVSCQNQNVMNPKDALGHKSSHISNGFTQLEPKEPDKKRLRITGSYSTKHCSDGPQELPTLDRMLISPSEVLGVNNSHLHNLAESDNVQKDFLIGRPPSNVDEWKKHDDMPSGNFPENIPIVQDGFHVGSHFNHSDDDKQVNSCVVDDRPTNMTTNIKITNSNHQGNISGPLTSTLNPTTSKKSRRNDFPEVISNHKAPDPLKSTCQAPSINRNIWNGVEIANVSVHHVKSIVEIEESLDKDLEEAQEHRYRCEVEERNAFKAYREAQRTLAEANARCVDLYHKRELYSAQIRSLMIKNSSTIFSSREHMALNVNLTDVTENNLLPTADFQIQPRFNASSLPQNDSNIQLANSDIHSSNQEANEHVIESEPCSEPVGIILKRLPYEGTNNAAEVCYSSSDPNMSVDENKSFPFENRSIEPSIRCLSKERDVSGGNEITHEAKYNYFSESAKDSLLLEARLRSELFQKLGKRNLQKNSDKCRDLGIAGGQESLADVRFENSFLNNREPHVDKGFACNIRCDKNQMSNTSASFSDAEDNQRHDLGEGNQLKIGNVFSSRLKSVFHHVNAIPQVCLEVCLRGNFRGFSNQNCKEEGCFTKFNGFQHSKFPSRSIHETVGFLCGREIGSYSCDAVLDSFLPICMYELRGKCNNDECPWQHIKDFSKNMNLHHNQRSNFSDHDLPHNRKADGVRNVPICQDSTTSTTYIVGLDILKSNLSSYGSSLNLRNDRSWKKFFSISLTLSIFSQKDIDGDGTFFHSGRIEVHGNYNKLSFFQSKNSEIQERQALVDTEHSLEMALLILNQEADKLDGLKKALPVLSRAVEADPTSAVIWVVYLLIFYSTMNPVGKHDMFSCAVKHNDRSYELWLLYINSRMQLDVRMNAYEDAISALCHHATFDGNEVHDSAFILDLFLQMINCICISGNVEKAIKKILSVIPEKSDEDHFALFSEILTCLTVGDKCIFWVSCLYLVYYRKLPDSVVQQFECEKELNELEWPAVHLTDDEKWRIMKLVETAVGDFDSCSSAESLEIKDNLRSAQVFALNHIRCVSSVDGLESGRKLLNKYTILYPFCIELTLLSARSIKHCQDGVNFEGFEDCLKNWPKELPGVQCIWNQYAEYALQNGRFEYAKELMVLWFDSVWSVGNSEIIRDSDSNQMDLLFGYINLSIFMVLQNNQFEARLAIDKALKAANPGTIRHCLKEYAMFLLTDESLLKEVSSIGGIRSIFEGYVNNVHPLAAVKPLSRNFITSIKRPRLQQLVGNLLNSFPPDFSLVNLVLEVWFGPSLLPRNFKEAKDLVDFVETILEISPSNYEIAISVCKLVSTTNGSSELTLPGFLFWAGSNLVSAIFHAIPIPPEFVWVEAASILDSVMGMEAISEKFYKRGLLVYPFSIKLWKSYYTLCKTRGDASSVIQAAKERGIELV